MRSWLEPVTLDFYVETNEVSVNFMLWLPVCSGGGVTVGGHGVGGVSGEVESEGGGSGSTGYGGDAVMDAGKYVEGTRVGPGVTCEYTVGGVAVVAAADEGRS